MKDCFKSSFLRFLVAYLFRCSAAFLRAGSGRLRAHRLVVLGRSLDPLAALLWLRLDLSELQIACPPAQQSPSSTGRARFAVNSVCYPCQFPVALEHCERTVQWSAGGRLHRQTSESVAFAPPVAPAYEQEPGGQRCPVTMSNTSFTAFPLICTVKMVGASDSSCERLFLFRCVRLVSCSPDRPCQRAGTTFA